MRLQCSFLWSYFWLPWEPVRGPVVIPTLYTNEDFIIFLLLPLPWVGKFFFFNQRNCIYEVMFSFSVINQGSIAGSETKTYASGSSINIKFDFSDGWCLLTCGPLVWIDNSTDIFLNENNVKSPFHALYLTFPTHPSPPAPNYRLGGSLVVLGSQA